MIPRLSIIEMQSIAGRRDGECLSNKYVSAKSPLKWRCNKKHIWWATPDSVKRGSWCKICSMKKMGENKKLTISQMRELAVSRGGKCLSTKYVNANLPLEWECAEKHIWFASPGSVKSGKWCKICSARKGKEAVKLTIGEMEEIAKTREGECLSKEYINANSKLKWKCKIGHIWWATPGSVKNGTWCRKCSANKRGQLSRLTLDQLTKIAKKNGGECLSNEYIDANSKLLWKCRRGHIWWAIPNSIKRGNWCKKCAAKLNARSRALTLIEMKSIAKIRGGKCLSSKYENNASKLIWQCQEGHIWEATPSSVKGGTWCRVCSTGISERICKKYFEIIFHKKFNKIRPKWLTSPLGGRMELDGYNEKLRVAFEYQGVQHYKQHYLYSRNLDERKLYDLRKRRLCKMHNIRLITVPYYIKYENLGKYIINKCRRRKIHIPNLNDKINYRLFTIYSRDKISEMQSIAKLRGGRCLSKRYINSGTKLLWCCRKGHTWEAPPSKIKYGSWCRECSGNSKLTLEDMHMLARKRGGKCLSIKYLNSNTKIKWCCDKGHIWETLPYNIKKGSWCPDCAHRKKLTIGDMRKIARLRGGQCLSKKYTNARTNLKWKCSKGHIWLATPDNVKKGTWCSRCAKAKSNLSIKYKQ